MPDEDERAEPRRARRTVATPAGLAARAPELTSQHNRRYRWAAKGDINAFFGLMLDNVVNLALLGYGRIRAIFIVSLVLITLYIYTRRRVFA